MWDKLPARITGTDAVRFGDEEWLRRSHERCAAARLDRCTAAPRRVLSAQALRELLAVRAGEIAYARLLFADIHSRLTDRTTVVLFTDARACVMELCSHPELSELLARHCGIKPGALLSEESCGTNAVWLALHHRAEAVVCGEQHYCRLFEGWTSAAAPVLDVDAAVVGCVSLSGSKKHGLG
jgi:transcriptional regulator of acetoin/glycerol metabolism